ncbi:predicted protein [Nematostella vectensis]|uniref:Uncharacterized protein n=1 Tax=Nematostella vectensis TaxID=45351 RepID=A7T0V1_NEMVE|nr:predicted protein [Nematostella vectensis]|eukprot:XP_001622519.1 predicted protein [Nematostella vectensis]
MKEWEKGVEELIEKEKQSDAANKEETAAAGKTDARISSNDIYYGGKNGQCTPHPTTGSSPAYLLMRRQPRTRFSALRPSLSSQKEADTFEQNVGCVSKFAVGDKVYVLNLRAGPRWLPGIVIEVLQRSYYVHVDGYPVWKRHEDQLRPRFFESQGDNNGMPNSPPQVVDIPETPAVVPPIPTLVVPSPLTQPEVESPTPSCIEQQPSQQYSRGFYTY